MYSRAVPREHILRLLDQWEQFEGGVSTHYVPPVGPVPEIAGLPRDIAERIESSGTGVVLFWDPSEAHLVLPPFPVETTATYDGWNTRPLMHLLQRPRTIGVLLLRLGRYGIGVFEDGTLVLSKAGSRFVKGRHRKGGASSGRFAHRREEQSNALYHGVCQALQEKLEEHDGPLDHFVTGGHRLTLNAFAKRCGYLKRFEEIMLPRTLNVDRPSLKAVQSLPRLLYESRVVDFSPTGREAGHGSSMSISTTVTPPPPS